MSAYKQLSEFMSDDLKRKAFVLKDLESGEYRVTVISDSGNNYTAIFGDEDSAEQFAEMWVLE